MERQQARRGLDEQTQVPDPIYTPKEVAQRLRCSERTVTAWIQSGTLSAVQYGKLIRIRQSDLDAFGKVLPSRSVAGAGAGAVQE